MPQKQELGGMKLIGKRGKNLKSGGKLRDTGIVWLAEAAMTTRSGEEVSQKQKKKKKRWDGYRGGREGGDGGWDSDSERRIWCCDL